MLGKRPLGSTPLTGLWNVTYNYALAGNTAAYSRTFNAAGVKTARKLPASLVSYTLTDNTCVPKISHNPFLATGVFSIAAHAMTASFGLPLGAAAYATSFNLAIAHGVRNLAATTISYTFSPNASTLVRARQFPTSQAAYMLSTHVATGKQGISLKPSIAVYSWAGSTVTPTLAKFVGATSYSLAFTGKLLGVKTARHLPAAVIGYAMSANVGGFISGTAYRLAASGAAYGLTPNTVSCNLNRLETGATGHFAVTFSTLKTTLATCQLLAQASYSLATHVATPKIAHGFNVNSWAFALNAHASIHGFEVVAETAHFTIAYPNALLIGVGFIGQLSPMVTTPPEITDVVWTPIEGFSAATASFRLTFSAAVLLRQRPPLVLATGLFGLLFDVCPLIFNQNLPAQTVSYGFGVVGAPLQACFNFNVSSISYLVDCEQLPVNYQTLLPLDTAQFTLQGESDFVYATNILVDPTSYTFGVNGLVFGYVTNADTGEFDLTPNDATPSLQLGVFSDTWIVAVSFSDITMSFGWNAPDLIAVSAMGLTASDATCGIGRMLPLDSANFGFIGNALIKFTIGLGYAGNQASLSWEVGDVAAQWGKNLPAASAAFASAWSDGSPRIYKFQTLDSASYGLSWNPVIAGTFRLVIFIGDPASYGLTPNDATPTLAWQEIGDPGAFDMQAGPMTGELQWRLPCDTTLYEITSALGVTTGGVGELVDPGDVALRFNSATCGVGRGMVVDPAEFGLGCNPCVADFSTLAPEAAFAFLGSPATARVDYQFLVEPTAFGALMSALLFMKADPTVVSIAGEQDTEHERAGRVTTSITIPGHVTTIEGFDE